MMSSKKQSADIDAHIRDCINYRKNMGKQLDEISKSQQRMHKENTKARKEEFGKLSNEIASIKQAEARALTRRTFWLNRAREALIAALGTALVYTVWHIIATKNMGPW